MENGEIIFKGEKAVEFEAVVWVDDACVFGGPDRVGFEVVKLRIVSEKSGRRRQANILQEELD